MQHLQAGSASYYNFIMSEHRRLDSCQICFILKLEITPHSFVTESNRKKAVVKH